MGRSHGSRKKNKELHSENCGKLISHYITLIPKTFVNLKIILFFSGENENLQRDEKLTIAKA